MTTVTSLSDLDLEKTYTYADYLLWKFEERVELIRGRIFKMSPAPSEAHQWISSKISGLFYNFFQEKNHDCRFYAAPFDVRLSKRNAKNEEITTVVQPDFTVLCDASKRDVRGCIGAPDLVVEILSPSNNKKEMQLKFSLYEENGIPEYWIIFPGEEILQQFVLDQESKYRLHKSYTAEDKLRSSVFPELEVGLEKVF